MNPDNTTLATDIVSQRITNMVLRHPFFSTILLNLNTFPGAVGTACTNGTDLIYDPDFIIGLGKEQVSGLLAHEVMHVALIHPYRCTENHDPKLANIAMDYEINGFLDTYNKEWAQTHQGEVPFPLPAGGLIDHKWDGMAWEQIYVELEKQGKGKQPQPGQGQPGQGQPGQGQPGQGQPGQGQPQPGQAKGDPNAPGDFGQVTPAPTRTPEGEGGQPPRTQRDWEAIVSKAEQVAKMQGNMPGAFASKLSKLRRPEIPWPEYMRRYFDAHAMDDYDSRRSDRRFLEQDIYLPTLHSEAMGELVVCIDTSGSIHYDKALLERFFSELTDIVARLRPSRTTVLQCDTRITKVDEYTPGSQIDVEVKGGGGTDFRPFFNHVAKANITPKVMVVFTDGYGDYPRAAPNYDVLWVDYGNYPNYPFGEVIRCKPASN